MADAQNLLPLVGRSRGKGRLCSLNAKDEDPSLPEVASPRSVSEEIAVASREQDLAQLPI
jgi:hypothetical protein